MDTNSENKELNYLDTLTRDGSDILYKLSKINFKDDKQPVEILADLPAAVNIDIIIGMVNRWREIKETMHRPLRVYAWSSGGSVEKYTVGLVNPIDNLYLTTLPTYLKERKKNVK